MHMPFPLSSHGTVSVYGADVGCTITRVRATLAHEELTISLTGDARLDFTNSDVFGLKSALIRLGDSGTVSFQLVDGWLHAQYRISFRRACIYVAILTLLAFGIVPVLVMGWHPASLLFVVASWSFLLGANYLTTAARFRAALERDLEACRPRASTGARGGI